MEKTLLAITEIGGYPDFTGLYQQAGYRVLHASSMRKAMSALKKESPAVIVAEFNFQSDFRDRTSNLETLMAPLQSTHADTRLVVIYEADHAEPLERFSQRWEVAAKLAFPVSHEQMAACLAAL